MFPPLLFEAAVYVGNPLGTHVLVGRPVMVKHVVSPVLEMYISIRKVRATVDWDGARDRSSKSIIGPQMLSFTLKSGVGLE